MDYPFFAGEGLACVQHAMHLTNSLSQPIHLNSEAQYEKARQDELRRGAFDLGAHLASQIVFLPSFKDGHLMKLLRVPLSMFDRHRAGRPYEQASSVAFFQEAPGATWNADRFGGQAGQLTWPKCMDIQGIDIFLPDTIELPLHRITVELRVGERTMYHTNLWMMTKRPEQNAYSDDLPVFVPVPTVQNFAVYLTHQGKPDQAWTDHAFGCRLRGVMYSEIC